MQESKEKRPTNQKWLLQKETFSRTLNRRGNPLIVYEEDIYTKENDKDKYPYIKETRYIYDEDDETVKNIWIKTLDKRTNFYKYSNDSRVYRQEKEGKVLSHITHHEETFTSDDFAKICFVKHTEVSVGDKGFELIKEYRQDISGRYERTVIHKNGEVITISEKFSELLNNSSFVFDNRKTKH